MHVLSLNDCLEDSATLLSGSEEIIVASDISGKWKYGIIKKEKKKKRF